MRLQTGAPASAGYFMPPEWAEHAGCWMAWPCREEAHGGEMAAARRAWAAAANAIAEFEPVMVVTREQDAAAARAALGGEVEVLPTPIDDAWMRDSGPTFVVNGGGEVAAVDWQFNAWGGKYAPWDNDDALAGRLARHLGAPRFAAPLVLEGGSFHVNGGGVLMTTRQCLLNGNRNPRFTREDIERLLGDYLGVGRFVWLAGDSRDQETDGHVDNIACFSAPGRALLMVDDDDAMLRENRRILEDATGGDGAPFAVVPLPRPTIVENGAALNASYANFYVANGGIVMPSFGLPEDAAARDIIADEYPGRKIRQIPALDIVRGGGGIHCITQQQPGGEFAKS